MERNPKHISFDEVKQLVGSLHEHDITAPFVSDELVVVRDSNWIFNKAIEMNAPYIIEDVRMLVVLEGEADVIINLMEYHLDKNTIGFLGYGTIIQPVRFSDDLRVCGMMMQKGLAERVLHNHMTTIHLAEDKTRSCKISIGEVEMLNKIHSTLWDIVGRHGYREDVVVPSLMTFSNYFVSLMEGEQQRFMRSSTHSNRVFKQFISLVNKHCTEEHSIGYYADQMCLSAHHLGLVVKSESGVTAKEWIERAVITQAKVLLKSSDLQAAEVASRLSFSNPAFFSKYFKRITGLTPQEYKRS